VAKLSYIDYIIMHTLLLLGPDYQKPHWERQWERHWKPYGNKLETWCQHPNPKKKILTTPNPPPLARPALPPPTTKWAKTGLSGVHVVRYFNKNWS
jgi:hypothetical protein